MVANGLGPWVEVARERRRGEIHALRALPESTTWVCPECLGEATIHDYKDRTWRDLDSDSHRVFVRARVPRLRCPRHGTRQVVVPWARPGSHFTTRFERLASAHLREFGPSVVGRLLHLTRNQVVGLAELATPSRHLRPLTADTLLDPIDVADALGITPDVLHGMFRSGELPIGYTTSETLGVPAGGLGRWLKARDDEKEARQAAKRAQEAALREQGRMCRDCNVRPIRPRGKPWRCPKHRASGAAKDYRNRPKAQRG